MAHLGRQQAPVGLQPPQQRNTEWVGLEGTLEITWFCLVLCSLWTSSQAGHPSAVSLPQNVLQKLGAVPSL